MVGALHIDMTATVARFVGWPAEHLSELAQSAAFPDQVRAVEVDGFGCHLFGHNFAAFTHFCVPHEKSAAGFRGYCYGDDRSLPGWDLPNRKVTANPWPVPEWFPPDPLSRLLHELDGKASTAVDELTFPTAAVMAEWCFELARLECEHSKYPDSLSKKAQRFAVSEYAGWAAHFAQDCTIPHHAVGMLAGGHGEFEAAQYEHWPLCAARVSDALPEQAGSVRALCEAAALEAAELGEAVTTTGKPHRSLTCGANVTATVLTQFLSLMQ